MPHIENFLNQNNITKGVFRIVYTDKIAIFELFTNNTLLFGNIFVTKDEKIIINYGYKVGVFKEQIEGDVINEALL